MIDAGEARALLPGLHDRWRRATPGAVGRDDGWWDFLLLDREHRRHGLSSLFHTVHPDGFVTYRVRQQFNEGFPANEVEVVDLFPATAGADADLWRFLLSMDLVGPIRTWHAPAGDPLPFLLDQPCQARTTNLSDDVWLRLLDVPAALAARTYQVDGGLVLGVHDGFLDRGGRFLLDGGPSGATCGRPIVSPTSSWASPPWGRSTSAATRPDAGPGRPGRRANRWCAAAGRPHVRHGPPRACGTHFYLFSIGIAAAVGTLPGLGLGLLRPVPAPPVRPVLDWRVPVEHRYLDGVGRARLRRRRRHPPGDLERGHRRRGLRADRVPRAPRGCPGRPPVAEGAAHRHHVDPGQPGRPHRRAHRPRSRAAGRRGAGRAGRRVRRRHRLPRLPSHHPRAGAPEGPGGRRRARLGTVQPRAHRRPGLGRPGDRVGVCPRPSW